MTKMHLIQTTNLHGAIGKHFWVTNDIQEINVVIYLFILFSVPKGCV